MKKDADIRGAELAPSSLTLGIESGSGVVSISCCWLNLVAGSQSDWFDTKETIDWNGSSCRSVPGIVNRKRSIDVLRPPC